MAPDPHRDLFRGKELQYLEQQMGEALWRSGGVPLLLPQLADSRAWAVMLARCDGLLLQGGADVAPSSYGQTPIRDAWAGDLRRDEGEISLIRAALELGKPILAVCRGIQVLNVALGGTLWQDIPTQIPDALTHRDPERYDQLAHQVHFEGPSRVRDTYGGGATITVNSVHHQALRTVASPLRVTARAPDGVIEAVEAEDSGQWIVGVQWHPEWLGESRPRDCVDGAPLFRAFTQACTQPPIHTRAPSESPPVRPHGV